MAITDLVVFSLILLKQEIFGEIHIFPLDAKRLQDFHEMIWIYLCFKWNPCQYKKSDVILYTWPTIISLLGTMDHDVLFVKTRWRNSIYIFYKSDFQKLFVSPCCDIRICLYLTVVNVTDKHVIFL